MSTNITVNIAIVLISYFFIMKVYWHSTGTFFGTFVDTLSAAFIISWTVITESLLILAKYSSFSLLHVVRFQI